ncbi:YihY/virulence factor BrkB family protein [Marivita hallyeonensis]|nr:YihY/virulence factor BrkB family protein [Marivita hallyeonensis]
MQIPVPGLIDVAMRIWRTQSQENLGLLAAGIAFFGLLSLFPAITAAVAIAGMITDPAFIVATSNDIGAVLPEAASDIILGQLEEVVGSDGRSLGLAALFALSLALYSASRATGNFIIGLNVIYGERESRGFVRLKALTLAMTLAMIVFFIASFSIVAAIPAIAAFFAQLPLIADILLLVRWPILFIVGATGIAFLYRFGPDRRSAKWRWLTPGAVLACLLWVAGSAGFSFYVQSFGTYNETFGALGGVIVLLTWLWLSAFIVLLGATIDAELEAQTRIDTTVGPDRPMGERGAVKADELGEPRHRLTA